MYMANRGSRYRAWRCTSWLTADRVVVYSCAMLLAAGVLTALWATMSHGFTTRDVIRPGSDFAVFWTASDMTLHGHAASVYDSRAFAHAQYALLDQFQSGMFLPWLYPPTMLLFVAPLSLVPFLPAYFLFFAGSFLCYAHALRTLTGLRVLLPRPRLAALVVLAYPAVFIAFMQGQNSIATAGIAALALVHLDRRPIVAGLLISLLAIKPQLAVLFPVALIAARAWRAFAAAAVGTVAFVCASLMISGTGAIHGAIHAVSSVQSYHLMRSAAYWDASPTTFAALRLAGAPLSIAYAMQFAVAMLAIASTVGVWRRTRDLRLRAAVLAIATLLTTPYLWHYELTWLGIAVFCLVAYGLEAGWLPGDQGVIVLAWLLPVFELCNRVLHAPQFGPVVLLAVLFVVVRRAALVPREL
ncbi:glycosyltransferase family 87 protein [Burkholderia guangdongensis]|uniref:glycosyltransferase family 87 protein n=1 Tax=Burkholderia guangdongensis TaxID=1792500 RepID=UPI0015CC77C4|nr:glycosyltransferase family 87 protein [Burkholderia guangdongensis]